MTPLLRVVTATCFAVLSAGVVDAGVPARPRSGSRLAGPCTGTNRVGFNSYMWECPLGLYFTPSGRFYDPEAGRFLQQDSYPGDIHNPPSLHRYTFGHGNPTSFVDPTGHESYRQWILLDKPTPSVGHEFLKQFGYDAFNVLSFGALSRQDALVEQSEAGRITEGQYRLGTATNAVGTGATAAATLATGGVVGSAVAGAGAGGSLALAGAASGGAAGLVGSTGSADVDMATGTRSPLDVHPTEFIAPTALGAASGYALGAGPAAGGRPVGELVPAPATLNSSRAVVVAEGLGGASAADQVRLVPVGQAPEPSVPVSGRPAISHLNRPGFVEFEGIEVRGVRDLSHVPEGTLRAMEQRGFAATDAQGSPLILHHLEQNPGGPLVEMPAGRHSIGNLRQHPLGNAPGAGLSAEQRAAFNQWRVEYWKARAAEELTRRGPQ